MEEKLVLVVEDEMLTAMLFRAVLQEMGFRVCKLASNSKTAIEVFRNEKPDVILMDIGLSDGLDGIETSKICKKENPELLIVFMTGYEDDEIRSRAMALKPLDYQVKPVDIHSIAKAIQDHLERKI